jgi:molybdopterin biosynthesis enzyme
MVEDFSFQRITRLTPLGTVLALIEHCVAVVGPQKSRLSDALGQVLAADVEVGHLPPAAIALRDGFAVEAAAVADAGPYAPVPLPSLARRIGVGEPLPSGTDAVLPLDAVAQRGEHTEAVAAVAAGEGVLPVGGDATPRVPLRRAGERLRAIDIAILAAAGVAELTTRAPRISVVRGGTPAAPLIETARVMLSRAVATGGGIAFGPASALQEALDNEQPDAIIAVGGTGSGQHDTSVRALAKHGRVEVHGIAISPGETTALGFVGARPVLLVPGRLDAVLAAWLLIGRRLVATLAGGTVDDAPAMLPLKRKVTSTIGLAEVVPVRCSDGMAEPLASGYLSLESLARSDGWIVIPAESEGFATGTAVAVRPWP